MVERGGSPLPAWALAALALAGGAAQAPAAALQELPAVKVTAERSTRPLRSLPGSVIVLEGEALVATGAQRLDDALRSIPGFTLFRRQSSLVANPTTQGASLRGIGATGASRAIVLLDGVPVGDPFGGWFSWGRIPLDLVERVEIVRGGGSSLWGNGALSGVIHVVTRSPRANQAVVRAEGGNRHTRRAAVIGEREWGVAAAQMDLSYDETGGYYLVADGARAPFDTRADSRELNVGARSDWDLSARTAATLRVRYFDERRDNGTAATDNDTSLVWAHAGIESETRRGDGLAAGIHGQFQDYSSTFSSQDRETGVETPALDQFEVPAGSLGLTARWWRGDPSGLFSWLAGADYSFTQGYTHEDYRFIDEYTRRRKAGGREHVAGAYLQHTRHFFRRAEVTAGVRVDYWRSEDGSRKERALDTGSRLLDVDFAARDEVFVSPRIGAVVRLNPGAALRMALYRGFRAPTLNELYRPFRVRNDITEANAALDLESMEGADLGFDLRWGRAELALTGYWNRLDDPIVNVTVGEGPGEVSPCGLVPSGGVCRQRRNLGATRTLGVELDARVEVASGLSVRGGYLWSDARITSDEEAGGVQGNQVPSVPEHQGVAGVDWRPWPRIGVSLEARYVGSQFEDDRNERRLEAFAVVNSVVSFALDDHWELYVKAENVFGDRYPVAETADGLVSYGPAALVNAGVRWRARAD